MDDLICHSSTLESLLTVLEDMSKQVHAAKAVGRSTHAPKKTLCYDRHLGIDNLVRKSIPTLLQ